jgi:hypothetical protein
VLEKAATDGNRINIIEGVAMTGTMRCLLLMAVSSLGIAGCSSSSADMPELAPVSGVVTLDGKPMSNVSVVFESENGQIATGHTDAEGHYELLFRDGEKGAEIGKNTVRIETVLDAPPPPGYRDPIPAKYNKASQLTVEVKPGDNTHDFALTSK